MKGACTCLCMISAGIAPYSYRSQIMAWGGTGDLNLFRQCVFVTGPEKTGLIYTKYTYSYCGIYPLFCACYPISVSFTEFPGIFCIYNEICVEILCPQNELLHLKD